MCDLSSENCGHTFCLSVREKSAINNNSGSLALSSLPRRSLYNVLMGHSASLPHHHLRQSRPTVLWQLTFLPPFWGLQPRLDYQRRDGVPFHTCAAACARDSPRRRRPVRPSLAHQTNVQRRRRRRRRRGAVEAWMLMHCRGIRRFLGDHFSPSELWFFTGNHL